MIEPEYLGSILAAAADLALFVNLEGKVLSILVNETEKSLGNLSHWEGRSIKEFLTSESLPKLEAVFKQLAAGRSVLHSIELNHRDNAIWQFPVRYSIHRLGSQKTVLMLGRDLRSLAETQQQLVRAQIAIERGHEERRQYDARFRMLLANIKEAILFVSVSDGKVLEINAPAASILGAPSQEIEGTNLSQYFYGRRPNEFLNELLKTSDSDISTEISAYPTGKDSAIKIIPSLFRAAGEKILLCRLVIEQETLSKDLLLSKNLLSLYKTGSDGIVFTKSNGIIESANESFLELINVANLSTIKGRNLANYLTRGQIDLAVMLENVGNSGQMRVYATELQNEFGSKLGVEVSVTSLDSANTRSIAFVIRDSSRSEFIRPKAENPDLGSQSNVAELVGSATLKEIVGGTNDIIEKICIETAIELTSNNRAAAAEMLGLSRQSLYVKLRKFGIIEKD